MDKVRQVVAYKHYFEEFLRQLPIKAQDKVFKIIEAIETFERVPSHYLKSLLSEYRLSGKKLPLLIS